MKCSRCFSKSPREQQIVIRHSSHTLSSLPGDPDSDIPDHCILAITGLHMNGFI